jgi:HEAT repeat protein
VALAVLVAACASAEALEVSQRIIDYLAVGDFGRASSLYRQQEALVLSPAAAPVWRRGLEHQNPSVREWSVDALSRIAGDGDFDLLVAALDDSSRGVRHQARDGIIRMDPQRAAAIFRDLLGSHEPDQIVLAAQGAAELEDAGAVHAIVDRLGDETLPAATRGTLAQPLAVIGDRAALAPLVEVASDPGADVQLRRLAAEGAIALAGELGDEEAIAVIVSLADSDDDYVRALAASAIEGLR